MAAAQALKAQRGETGENRRHDLEAQLQALRQEIATLGHGTEAWGLRLREAARMLRSLAGLTGAHALLDRTAEETMWAGTQYDLALALRHRGRLRQDINDLKAALAAVRRALAARPDMASWRSLRDQLAAEIGSTRA